MTDLGEDEEDREERIIRRLEERLVSRLEEPVSKRIQALLIPKIAVAGVAVLGLILVILQFATKGPQGPPGTSPTAAEVADQLESHEEFISAVAERLVDSVAAHQVTNGVGSCEDLLDPIIEKPERNQEVLASNPVHVQGSVSQRPTDRFLWLLVYHVANESYTDSRKVMSFRDGKWDGEVQLKYGMRGHEYVIKLILVDSDGDKFLMEQGQSERRELPEDYSWCAEVSVVWNGSN